MVFWYHVIIPKLPLGHRHLLGWLRAGTNLTWSGVDLFFVLSGFLIGGILIDNRDSPNLTRVFYARRATRILPLYYVTLALIWFVLIPHLPGAYSILPGWVYALFLSNVAVGLAQSWDWISLSLTWSLAVEEQFYLSAPWVIRAVRPERIPWLAAGIALAAELFRVLAVMFLPSRHQFILIVDTPFRMDTLALGILAAWVVRSARGAPFRSWLGRNWKACMAAGAVLFLGLDALMPTDGSPVLAVAGYGFLAAFYALVVLVVFEVRPAGLSRLLGSAWLSSVGRYSYFMYLWHATISVAVFWVLAKPDFVLDSAYGAAVALVAFAATWGAAWVSWRWFEGPVVRWGHKLSYR
jgi:peptidoglycan/LPS O-acetylase OafA/YrhL